MPLQWCVSVGEPTVRQCLALLRRAAFAEVRLDLIGDISPAAVKAIFSRNKEWIVTCRSGRFSEAERLALLGHAVEAGAAYLDLDLDSDLKRGNTLFSRRLLPFAETRGCRLIASRHFFEKMPSDRVLFSTVRRLAAFDPAFIKVAARAKTEQETARLLALMALDERVVPVPMGEWGPAGRVSALLLGAPFTYVSSDRGRATAPGQLSEKMLTRLLSSFRVRF